MTITAPSRPPLMPPPARGAPARRQRASRVGTSTTRTLISDAALRRGRTRVLYFATLTLVTILFALVFLFPLYWMVTGAVKDPAWDRMHIARYFGNTVLYAVGGWLIQLGVDVAVAYALSKLRPVLGKLVLAMMLASLMLPPAALLIPTYLTITKVPIVGVNLLNTPWALWLPAAANAVNIYILKRFFDQIPDDLLDAAALDGAGRVRILRSIVLPLSRPVLGVVSILAIVGIWKDFLWPLVVLQDTKVQTLSVALSRLSNTSQVPPTEFMAGLVIASIPMIVIFLIFQRSIIGGLSAGSMKG